MDNFYTNIGAVKTIDIDGELYISCWDFSKALIEKEREISDLCKENDELQKQISELESELAVKEDLLKIKNGLCDEKPLLFYCDEYEKDRIDEMEKRIAHLEDYLAEEKERKIKELEAEQALMMQEAAHYQFISELVRPLKP